jgi:hypothetical protein
MQIAMDVNADSCGYQCRQGRGRGEGCRGTILV